MPRHGKKSTSSFTFFLRYWKDIANLLFRVLWACLALYTQSDAKNLQKGFCVYLQGKNQLHHPYFSGDIANFLFWILWASLTMYTQNYSNFDVVT